MPLRPVDGLRCYQFDLFDNRQLFHGIFSRSGGVSPAPWASLNLGGTVGDERANVIENRRRLFSSAGLPVESLYDVWQVHGTRVVCTGEPRPLDAPFIQADAILTDNPNVTLFMRFADCVPIFLYDPNRKVIGIVHAGWKGTVDKILVEAIRVMSDRYQSKPGDLRAGIGPSICREHYEVGEEVVSKTHASFGGRAGDVLFRNGGKYHLDLWEANRILLEQNGVKAENIQVSGICTAENTGDWYSHRAEKGKTGRFGALFSLKS
jgi:YfiH family protein